MERHLKSLLALILIPAISACDRPAEYYEVDLTQSDDLPSGCSQVEAKETDGIRRLALLVGVGDYKNPTINDLSGPPNDVRRIYQLLTGPNGYGFPKENVCVLLNEHATTARFKEMFTKSLVNRARKDDVAVVFFAGHGSRKIDTNGDEPGRWDSTIMLYDSRDNGIDDLVDDEFNEMLVRLYDKTRQIVVITDACHSGTVTRGGSGYIARFQPPAGKSANAPPGLDGNADSWVPKSMPEVVSMSATTDESTALEKNGRGLFTEALWQVMSEANNSNRPLTYAQVARRVPPLIAAQTYQIPFFHGDLGRAVFQNTSRTRPIAWEVNKVGPPIELAGPPWPGMSQGAELRIYDGGVIGADTRDPDKAKASVIIDNSTSINATAHMVGDSMSVQTIEPGDLAVLVRPGDAALEVKVRIRPADEAGGVEPAMADVLRKQIAENHEAKMFVKFVENGEDYELSLTNDGSLLLSDTNSRPRNRYEKIIDVAENLWHHSRQRAFRQLRGETGKDYVNDETLQVQLVPASKQMPCAKGVWDQAEPNRDQVLPLCHAWNIKVTMKEGANPSLLIGAVVLSADGGTFALPADGRKVQLKGGESVVFQGAQETFVASPPLDVQDLVIVFGTQLSNPVEWRLLTSTAKTRAGKGPASALHRALNRYLVPGTRGQHTLDQDPEDTTWTTSAIAMHVEANSRFLKPGSGASNEEKQREYTIKRFDIRPYLPGDPTTALYKVLMNAHQLATASVTDGYSFKQHDWSLPTPEENLQKGIDCSRTIWYVFKYSGLPYNREDKYLPTISMVSDTSWMNDRFERCDLSDLRTGDVLVYRDDTRGDGHTVMVIDPLRRIAVGSHGYDGTPRDLPVEPDTGVEYQLIKYKKDWQRWDRQRMLLKACWRYRQFIEEAEAGRNLPGLKALDPNEICSPIKQCGAVTGKATSITNNFEACL